MLPSWCVYYYFWSDLSPSRPLHVSLAHLQKRKGNKYILENLFTVVPLACFENSLQKTLFPSCLVGAVDLKMHMYREKSNIIPIHGSISVIIGSIHVYLAWRKKNASKTLKICAKKNQNVIMFFIGKKDECFFGHKIKICKIDPLMFIIYCLTLK